MKHCFLCIVAVLLAGMQPLSAQNKGAFFLSTPVNEAFIISLNYKVINAEPLRAAYIQGIPEGQVEAEVTVLIPAQQARTFIQQVTVAGNLETLFELTWNGQEYQLTQTGTRPVLAQAHYSQACYNVLTPQGSNFAQGNFTVVQVVNGYKPGTNSWDAATGWPDYQAPVEVAVPAACGDTFCSYPMSEGDFKISVNRLKAKPIESTRLAIAKDIVENGCFTSLQVKELMTLFATDDSRVELGKLIWHHLSDTRNWSFVYDAFTYGNKIEELKNYVKLHPLKTAPVRPVYQDTVVVVVSPPPAPEPVYAVPGYTSPLGCAWPMEATVFNELKTTMSKKTFGKDKMITLTQSLDYYCLTTEQAWELIQLFPFDSERVEAAKVCWDHCYDYGNFFKVNDTFTFESSFGELEKYMNDHPRTPFGGLPGPAGRTAPVYGCTAPMDVNSFNALKSSISNVAASHSKMSVLKQAVGQNCLSVAQVKEILGLFTFETYRLDAAKFCWMYCYDYSNYHLVNEVFSSTFSVEHLAKHRQDNPR